MARSQRRSRPAPPSRGTVRRRSATAEAAQPDPVDVRGLAPLLVPGTAGTMMPAAGGQRPLDPAAVVALQRTHGNAHVTRLLSRAQADAPRAVQRDTAAAVQRAIPVAHARWLIKKASAGAGTDEGAIYEAIRRCDDRAALKADLEVQRLLKSEMKGHDLWKAQLLLEFGSEAAFPPPVQAIWGATKGAGTDERAIYTAIDKLKPGELDELLKIPGLRGILKADLNKGELKRATGGAGISDRHKRNVAAVKNVLTEMKAPGSPVLDQNTAEWMEPTGGGAAKIALYVLTKTHDSADRAKKHGNSGQLAYFGKGQRYPDDSADYDLAIASTRNIYYADKGVAGEHQSRKIWLMDPRRRSTDSVKKILVHEVQHDADKHERDPDWSAAFKSPEESWVRYRTEFRAYWVEGRFDDKSVTPGTAAKVGFANARQQAIFDHLWGTSERDSYAEWLRPNYTGNTTVGGRRFQDLVHGYTHPEGFNLINSPRIDDFYRRLRACSTSDTNWNATPLIELRIAATALNPEDRLYVNSSRAAALQQMMKDNLAAVPLRRIATTVNGGTLPKWAS